MPQVKIYGLKKNIEPKRFALSDVVHRALMEGIGTPEAKRFQRFILLESENFLYKEGLIKVRDHSEKV
jgi:hypothetical protein